MSLWQHRFRETGNIMTKRGSGRSKKLNLANEEDIFLDVLDKPITTSIEKKNKAFIDEELRLNELCPSRIQIYGCNLHYG